jgi:hypothetical protein
MDILAGIMGVVSMLVVVLGFGLIVLGQKIGTWKPLADKEKGTWQRKLSNIAFKYVMPAGIVISVVLVPLLVLLGLITFVVMLATL